MQGSPGAYVRAADSTLRLELKAGQLGLGVEPDEAYFGKSRQNRLARIGPLQHPNPLLLK